jgi:hypothetical protein
MTVRFRLFVFSLIISTSAFAQTDVAALVTKFQDDPRGPYRDIAWFCADGTVVASVTGRCATEGGKNKQHARYKSEIIQLGKDEHIFLGQILTDTKQTAFWDDENDHSRMKQYMLGNYLAAIDDGWINRKGQFYRGALQVEDEMEWGRAYLNWLMEKETALKENFYLIRQAVRDIPHRKDDNLTQKIRNDSKLISEKFDKFMQLRIKIHGQPEGADAGAVERFLAENREALERRELAAMTQTLAADIRTAYVDRDLVADIVAINKTIPEKNGLKEKIARWATNQAMTPGNPKANTEDRLTSAANLMWTIRTGIMAESPYYRLEAMDISIALERLIFNTANDWQPADARELMEKICYLAEAAAGAGYVEEWEWQEAQPQLADLNYQLVRPAMATRYLDVARRFVEWGVSTNRGTFGEVADRYASSMTAFGGPFCYRSATKSAAWATGSPRLATSATKCSTCRTRATCAASTPVTPKANYVLLRATRTRPKSTPTTSSSSPPHPPTSSRWVASPPSTKAIWSATFSCWPATSVSRMRY